MSGPLQGVKVIELAGLGPAPYACMLLADMGADILRLERGDAEAKSESEARGLVELFMKQLDVDEDVATILAEDGGLRVLAPDMRGFGEGPRVPPGDYYHFPDYVLDLASIVDVAAVART